MNNKTTRQTELPLNTGKGIHSFPRLGARGAATGTHRRQPTRIERAAWCLRQAQAHMEPYTLRTRVLET